MNALLPDYLIEPYFWKSIWPILLAPLLVSLAISFIFTRQLKRRPLFNSMLIAALALSMLGIVTGNITGLSRDPAVGTVVPAILTLVSGILVYLLGSKDPEKQTIVSGGVICLAICLVVGLYWGARSRVLFEFKSKAYETVLNSPSAKRASEITAEDTQYALALKRLQNETKFVQLKAALEVKYNQKFLTAYPAQVEPSKKD